MCTHIDLHGYRYHWTPWSLHIFTGVSCFYFFSGDCLDAMVKLAYTMGFWMTVPTDLFWTVSPGQGCEQCVHVKLSFKLPSLQFVLWSSADDIICAFLCIIMREVNNFYRDDGYGRKMLYIRIWYMRQKISVWRFFWGATVDKEVLMSESNF